MGFTVYQQSLARAADILGGTEALRLYLGVSMLRLNLWVQGREQPPADVFLRIVDLLNERDLQSLRRPSMLPADEV